MAIERILNERYELIGLAGKGGFSSVYIARDIKLNKKWAIKFVSVNSSDMTDIAINEIEMMRELDNPLFPRLVDAFKGERGYYIVSDYIDGITMSSLVLGSPLGVEQTIHYGVDILKGLKYLHSRSPAILFLDLKLDNVMVRKDGTICLIDFGIARTIYERNTSYGTPGYAPPEQYRGRASVLDRRADIFAFGMLMYAMLSGKAPNSDYYLQKNVIINDRHISGKLKSIILKCICYNKADRYSNVDDIIKDLEQLLKKNSKLILILFSLVILSGLIIFILITQSNIRRKESAAEMLSKAGEHMKNGIYDEEGMQIICSYIDSGCLDFKTEQRFCYEAAMFYFNLQKDYDLARKYFERLDKDNYEEAGYYVKLCNFESSFVAAEEYFECLEEFEQYNSHRPKSIRRYNNALMISALYESEIGNFEEAQNHAVSCLLCDYTIMEKSAVSNALSEDMQSIFGEYSRRLFYLFYRYGEAEEALKYGINAVNYLDESKSFAIEEINNIINRIRDDREQRLFQSN